MTGCTGAPAPGFTAAGANEVLVAIWPGDDDRFVPFSHGVWIAASVPGAKSCLKAGEGHLSLVLGRG